MIFDLREIGEEETGSIRVLTACTEGISAGRKRVEFFNMDVDDHYEQDTSGTLSIKMIGQGVEEHERDSDQDLRA